MRYGLLILVIAVSALEVLADLRPFAGIWWTHKEAMDYGGLAVIAVASLLLLRRGN